MQQTWESKEDRILKRLDSIEVELSKIRTLIETLIESNKEQKQYKNKPYKEEVDCLRTFIENQRPLEPEFAKTLNDNLWALYA